MRTALERLRTAKLYGRLHKCEFFQQSVEYLGYTVSSTGIKASEDKIRAIVDWPQPTSVRDIRSFLGLANYYRRFVKDFSKIARPLTDLTQAKVKFQWGQDQEAAFNRLKYLLATTQF